MLLDNNHSVMLHLHYCHLYVISLLFPTFEMSSKSTKLAIIELTTKAKSFILNFLKQYELLRGLYMDLWFTLEEALASRPPFCIKQTQNRSFVKRRK